MEYLRKIYQFGIEKYNLLITKKYTTLAGTLVYFFIMSIVPLSFWLTIFIGKLPVDIDRILALPVFESVKDTLVYVRQEALKATASVSVFLLLTTLYSSTTFFYQMRRSGEIIYDYRRTKKGFKMRVGALILLLICMIVLVAFLLLVAFGAFLFARFLPSAWEKLADYLLLAGLSFLLVLLLNIYVCPYKSSWKDFIWGTLITVGAWIIAVIGFSVYMKIGNVGRLYGALSTAIVFLLWLYVLMIGFIIGVIFNSEKITRAIRKERRRKKRVLER